jgi:hypothetical protein
MVNLVSESSKNTRQAHNLFIASKGLPMLSRPILLLYVFEILANVLSFLTFKTKKRNGWAHLFQRQTNWSKSRGLFQRFHDCYCFDLSIYIINCACEWQNQVNKGYTSHMDLSLLKMVPLLQTRIKNKNTLVEVSVHKLDRGFIFRFGLSTLALYSVNEWNNILGGRNDDLIIRIKRYLQ